MFSLLIISENGFVFRGIPYISLDRDVRMNSISAELSTGNYDIVSLQEVWSQMDYETLKCKTELILPFSHYFYR